VGELYTYRYTVRDKVTRQCPQATTFEEKGEPKLIRTEVRLPTSLMPYRSAKPDIMYTSGADAVPSIYPIDLWWRLCTMYLPLILLVEIMYNVFSPFTSGGDYAQCIYSHSR